MTRYTIILMITGVAACGPVNYSRKSDLPQDYQTASEADSGRKGGKHADGRTPAETGNGNAADATAAAGTSDQHQALDMDCEAVAQHGTHEGCDDDDLLVQEQGSANSGAGGEPADSSAESGDPSGDGTGSTDLPADSGEQPADTDEQPADSSDQEEPADDPTPPPPPPPTDPNVVEFRIKAGTGRNPWNTKDAMVTVKVGQTLRLINEDTVTHRLHTGGAPCPHGTNFAPGETFDCVVTRPLEPGNGNSAPTYDHIVGNTASFWLRALP